MASSDESVLTPEFSLDVWCDILGKMLWLLYVQDSIC